MTERAALLIGVAEYDDQRFPALPRVRNDVGHLRETLLGSGYEVTVFGVGGEEQPPRREPSVNRLKDAIDKACQAAPAGGTLLIYFSGHGVSVDGRDFLVPSDPPDDLRARPEERLVPVDITRSLNHCPAEQVILCVDACREEMGPAAREGTDYATGFGGGELSDTQLRQVTIYGCRPGERCGFGRETSLFAAALAEALDAGHEATTLGEVIEHARSRLRALSDRRQTLSVKHAHEPGSAAYQRRICDGPEQVAPWRDAVKNARVWDHVHEQSQSLVEALRIGAMDLAAEYAKAWQRAEGVIADDPWSDPHYPIRCVRALDLLLKSTSGSESLTAASAAVLVTAPFLREAVLAEGLRHAAEWPLDDVEAAETPTDQRQMSRLWANLRREHQSNPQVVRRARRLRQDGDDQSARAVELWFAHRWRLREPDLWTSHHATRLLGELVELVQPVGDPEELTKQLQVLTRTIATSLEHAGSEQLGANLEESLLLEPSRGVSQKLRLRRLALLLSFAGLMAMDARQLPRVVVTHIGLRTAGSDEPLSPATVVKDMQRVYWSTSEATQTPMLRARCSHHAIDAALRERAGELDELLQTRWEQARGGPLPDHPVRLDTSDVKPREEGLYSLPHLSLQLAHDEIRELLMGSNLWGDPELAVRELYQNALDACRYRQVRRRYLELKSQEHGGSGLAPWSGRIVFSTGTEGHRRYIECADNGVGMSAYELEHTFARAGRSFVQTNEFLDEQADWLRLETQLHAEGRLPEGDTLRLHPNSQFGFGIFSYFTLVDEVRVLTSRVGKDGRSARPLQIDIASSGSLFKVIRSDAPLDGGTKIRLYIDERSQHWQHISIMGILRERLLLADFEVLCQEGDQEIRWEPGVPYKPLWDEEIDAGRIPVQAGRDRTIWWIAGTGQVLADGLTVERPVEVAQPFGYMINLTGRQRPALSVDRSELQEWHASWMWAQLTGSIGNLEGWPGLTMRWLWEMTRRDWPLAQAIYEQLVRDDIQIPVSSDRRTAVPISQVGCIPFDEQLITPDLAKPLGRYGWLMSKMMSRARVAIWRRVYPEPEHPIFTKHHQTVAALGGFAIPEPRDAALLSAGTENPYRTGRPAARLGIVSGYRPRGNTVALGLVARISGEGNVSLNASLRRLRRFVINGLEIPRVQSLESLEQADFSPDSTTIRCLERALPDPPVGLMRASEELGEPIGRILERLRPFAVFDLGDTLNALLRSPATPGDLTNRVCTDEDITIVAPANRGRFPGTFELLAASVEAERPLREVFERRAGLKGLGLEPLMAGGRMVTAESLPSHTPDDLDLSLVERACLPGASFGDGSRLTLVPHTRIIRAADDLAIPVEDAKERLRSLEPLGLRILEPGDWHPDLDLLICSANLDGLEPWLTGTVSITHLIHAAELLETTLSTVRNRLAAVADEHDLQLPNVPDQALAYQPTAEDLCLISQELKGRPPWVTIPVSRGHVMEASRRFGLPPHEIITRLIRLGCDVVPAASWPELNEADRLLLSARLSYKGKSITGVVPTAHILLAAFTFETTFGGIHDRLRDLAPDHGLQIPPLPDELREHRPTRADIAFAQKDTELKGPLDVAKFAASKELSFNELLRSLDRAHALGAPLPFQRRPEPDSLADVAPIEDDLELLDWYALKLSEPGQLPPVSRLYILLTAGKLGWTVQATLDRLRLYEPLGVEIADLPDAAPGAYDFVPSWQDVVLPTEMLDGREPLITGVVSKAHVMISARELEETPVEIAERLRKLSPLTGTVVPDGDPEGWGD